MRNFFLHSAAILYDYYSNGSSYYKPASYYYTVVVLWNIVWTNVVFIVYLLDFDIFSLCHRENKNISLFLIGLFLFIIYILLIILIPEKKIKAFQFEKKKWKIAAIISYTFFSYIFFFICLYDHFH